MKLELDSETIAEKKALILYIMDKVNKPISNDSLLKLTTSIDNMNYFYFQQFLLDLLDNKYIINYEENGESIYKLTKDGIETLKLVKDTIPGIYKFRVDNSFKNTLSSIENKMSITSEFIPKSKKEYTVKCKIIENSQTLFELEIYAGSREQAKSISENWNKNAENLYPQIIEILTKVSGVCASAIAQFEPVTPTQTPQNRFDKPT